MANTLKDRILALPDRIRLRLGFGDNRRTSGILKETINVATEVVSIMPTPGMAAIREESDKLDRLMLEEVASEKVVTWEQYLELRGRLVGFRYRQNIGNELVRAGVQAEQELSKLQKQGKD